MAMNNQINNQKRKRAADEPDIAGYLMGLSPMKMSKGHKQYFDGQLQTAEGVRRVVCFSPEKHEAFRRHSVSDAPAITLRNCRTTEDDIFVNAGTRLIPAVVGFERQPEEPVENTTIGALLADFSPKQVVSIEAKVMGVKEQRHKIRINGRETQMEEVHVSDDTGTIPLKVWGQQTESVKVGKSYVITNVGTRFYEFPYLTTTLKTEVTETEDVVGAARAPEIEELKIRGQICAAMVTVTRQCSACQGVIQCVGTSPLVRCSLCQMRQKVESVDICVKADIFVKGEQSTRRLRMGDNILKNMVGLDCANMEEVEDFLLLKDSWEITYQESQVISASFM